MSKVIFSSEVWGDVYVDKYINYIYPNHLACIKQVNNIDYEYWLYTSVHDFPRIESSTKEMPNLKIMTREKYDRYDNEITQVITMKKAWDIDASVFILAADCIFPINTFSNILEIKDKKLFFVPWFRVNTDVTPYLKDCDYSPRNLIKLCLPYLHTKFTRHCMNKENYDVNKVTTQGYVPSALYWKYKDSGFLMRTFHLHPLFFRRVPPPRTKDSIDQGVYLSTAYSTDEVCVITDSDVAVNIDIDSDPSLQLPLLGSGRNPTKKEMHDWAKRETHRVMREIMKYTIYIHSEDLNVEWESIKVEADKFVSEAFSDLLNCKELY